MNMEFKTTDFEITCALRAAKAKLLDIRPKSHNTKQCEFIFEDTLRLRDLVRNYGTGDLQVSALAMIHALADTKSWMYLNIQNAR